MHTVEVGIVLSLLTAISWSLATVLYKVGLKTENSDVIVANGIRTIPSLIFMLAAVAIMGEIYQIHNLSVWLFLLIVVDVSFGILLGDSLFLVAIRDAGVAIGHPVSYTYSLFVAIFAYFFLQETINIWTFISAILVVLGVFLLFLKAENSQSKHMVRGLIAAIMASLSWGISMTILKIVLLSVSPVFLNLVRLLILNIIVWLLILSKERRKKELKSMDKKTLLVLSIGGIFAIGLGSLLFLFAINLIGVAKTTIIASSSPLFSTILGTTVLKEKLDKLRLLGIAVIILGIYTLTIA